MLQQMNISQFMPHGHCYLWRTDILIMHVLGNLLTSLSYFSIPLVLWIFWKNTRHNNSRLTWIIICFAAFIFLCGITHAFSIYTTWVPHYFLEGILKSLTAIVSLVTAILSWYLLPELLKIPSSSELIGLNKELNALNASLEHKVKQATESWTQTNRSLQREADERVQAMAKLTYMREATNDGWFVFNLKENKFEFSSRFMTQMERPYDGRENGILYFESILQPKSRVLFRELLGDLKQSPHSELQEIQVSLKDFKGKLRYFILKAKVDKSNSGEIDIVYGSLIDNSTDQKYKTKLKKLNSALEGRNQELGQFINVASHDLKSPLRAISNLSEWIAEDKDSNLSEQSRQDFEEIQKRSIRMQNLLDGLLEYSRIGRSEHKLERVDLNLVVSSCIEVAEIPELFKIHVKTLPTIQSYPVPVEMAVRNIIQNAVNHRLKDSGQLWIESELDSQNEFYKILFKDDGKGVAKKDQERIFQMFKTGSDKSVNSASTGVGLALVQRAMLQCGGAVLVESKGTRQGACFILKLPIRLDP